MNKLVALIVLYISITACKQPASITNPISSAGASKALFHQGLRNHLTGNTKKAIQDFEACLKINPLDDAAHFAIAQAYLLDLQLDQAAVHTEMAAKLDPKNNYYISELAYMYDERNEHKKAALFFERLINVEKNNSTYYIGAIDNYAALKDYTKALKILNRLINIKGIDISLQMEKYNLYNLMNESGLALKTLEEGCKLFENDPVFLAILVDTYMENKQYELAFSLLEELVLKDPENGLATLLLGEMYMEKKDFQKGLKLLKIAVTKEGPTIDQKMNILIQAQKIAGCGADVHELTNYMVNRYPENAKSFTIRGDCLMESNDKKGALASYQKAVKINPDLFPVWKQILVIEYQEENWESLYETSLEAISIFPTSSFISLTAGIAANKTKKYTEALDFLNSGMQFITKDDATEAEMLSQMGDAYFGLKQTEKACDFYEQALLKAPESATIRSAYALQLAKNNLNLDYAEKLADLSISQGKKSGLFLAVKGYVLLTKYNYIESLSTMLNAKELDPRNALILDWLGDAYFFNGNVPAAVAEWEVAKELGSKNEWLSTKINAKKYYAPSN